MLETFLKAVFFLSLLGAALPAAAEEPSTAVRQAVYGWRHAWESRDTDRYMHYYSRRFQSKNLGYEEWRRKSKSNFEKTERIQVKITNLQVTTGDGRAVATFDQHYESPGYSDFGKKQLVLVREGGRWKIVSESWEAHASGQSPAGEKDEAGPKAPEEGSLAAAGDMAGKEPAPESHESGPAIRTIRFQTGGDGTERVLIEIKPFVMPSIQTIEGRNPRIVIDVAGVSAWDGDPKTVLSGKLIEQVRAHLHEDTKTLRIVLDLNPEKGYAAHPIYYKNDGVYGVEIREETTATQGR